MKSLSTEQAKVISQDMLAIAMMRKEEKDEADRLYKEARQSIVSLVISGAEVEPGPLDFRVISSEQRRFSAEESAQILGRDEAERLRQLMPAKVVRTLRVFEAGGSEEEWKVDDWP